MSSQVPCPLCHEASLRRLYHSGIAICKKCEFEMPTEALDALEEVTEENERLRRAVKWVIGTTRGNEPWHQVSEDRVDNFVTSVVCITKEPSNADQ